MEILLEGLLGHTRRPHLEAVHSSSKGRAVVAREGISKGQYVCEYRTYRVYPVGSEEEARLARENEEGSYVLSTAHTVPGAGTRLSFDATTRYRDIGRLINHSPKGFNSTPGSPVHVRGKWRVGMVAVRDIAEGEELVYDYGVRSEDWMKARKKARSREQDVPDRDSGCVDGAAGESREGSPDISVVEISRKSGKKVVYKRNFFWCPEQDCASGPVQKVTQHLQKVHKMDPATAARVASKKRQATPEAVRLKMPNPKTRSSGLQHIALFAKKTPATPSPPVPRTSSPKRPGIIFSIRRSRVGRSTWRR